MATITITLTDMKSKDGRRGVEIKRLAPDPVLYLGGEPAPTAAQCVGICLVEEARRLCDELNMPIEQESGVQR